MSIEIKQVKKLADLAKLQITEEGSARLTHELTNILGLVKQLDELDTSSIVPMAHPLDEKQTLRPDVVSELDQREALLKLAPQTYAGLYIVPKVIETE